MADTGTCRSCGAAILWAENKETGKKMPLDAKPNPAGNVFLHASGRASVIKAADKAMVSEGDFYMSHFATCPNAAQHRKPK